MGSLRETFLLNQLHNSGHTVTLPKSGDFLVNNKWTLEVGGTSKKDDQIKNVRNNYLAMDGIERAFHNRIPLWLFGFMY